MTNTERVLVRDWNGSEKWMDRGYHERHKLASQHIVAVGVEEIERREAELAAALREQQWTDWNWLIARVKSLAAAADA
jgi:hypothetical protein